MVHLSFFLSSPLTAVHCTFSLSLLSSPLSALPLCIPTLILVTCPAQRPCCAPSPPSSRHGPPFLNFLHFSAVGALPRSRFLLPPPLPLALSAFTTTRRRADCAARIPFAVRILHQGGNAADAAVAMAAVLNIVEPW